jgi:intraflagellar transport protein 140
MHVLASRCMLSTHSGASRCHETVPAVGAEDLEAAVALLEREGLPLTDDLADLLSPAKGTLPDGNRLDILRSLAKVARKQGLFQLAAKKYTQAGDRTKAMKALMHTHDREKVILFANVSRDPEVFLMAAQYLQTTGNWLQDAVTLKKILQFYTKAKRPLHLAAFYEACAQAEIDECRDYRRAADAMQARTSSAQPRFTHQFLRCPTPS